MSAVEPKVYVIDDDESIRSSLTRALGKRGFSVDTFPSADAFLDAYDTNFLGCIVLDHGMPGMTGLELQQVLLEKGRALPIIFITGHGGVPESVQAMKLGAIDFLEKPFRSEVLVDRIKVAFQALATATARQEKAASANAKFATLTAREMEIVDFMVSNPSHTTSKDVARALEISPRTVDHHRARILEKMQISSIVELVDLSRSAQSDVV
ncbi:MAG: response regulator [Litoreibacter sp.]